MATFGSNPREELGAAAVEQNAAQPQTTAARLARLQGGYFIATGVWPLVHLRSFEAVTGPKPEGWLVKMVGLLAATIGATLVQAGRRGRVSSETRLLACASAASFAAIDVWYVARRRIAPVYLLDAVVEVGLLAAWARLARRG